MSLGRGTVATLAALALLAGGCLAERPMPSGAPPARPSDSASPSAASSSRPTPTAIPPIGDRGPAIESFDPNASLEPLETPVNADVEVDGLRAVAEVDGVRVSIQVGHNPLIASETAWVTTTLANTGRDTLHWMTDGCSIHVGVSGEMPMRWAPGFAQPEGVAKKYKDWALDAILPDINSPIWLDATPEPFLGRDFGCADVGLLHELEPGRRLRMRHQWNGLAAPQLGLPPSGPAAWIATFREWFRESEPCAKFVDCDHDPIVVRLPVDILSNRDDRMLSAGQAIDVALQVPEFRALLEANPKLSDWDFSARQMVRFDLASKLWVVTLHTNDGFEVAVHIDPVTGAVRRVDTTP